LSERFSMRTTLSGERRSRRVRAEDRLIETAIMYLPLAKPENDPAQCPSGVWISKSRRHLLLAAPDLLCEHSPDQLLTGREMPVDGRNAHASPPGDLTHGQVKPLSGEGVAGNPHQVRPVVLGIRPRFPSQCSWHSSHFPYPERLFPFSLLP
jgi:hypothetical protein